MSFKKITTYIAVIFMIFYINGASFFAYALAPSDITDHVFFLDAQNVDGDNNAANEPATNSSVSTVIDSFNAFTGSQNIASKQPEYITNSINIYPSLKFDGTADYLNIRDNQTINTGVSYSQKSYALLIKTGNDITTFQTIYEEGGKEKGYAFQIDNGHLYAGVYNSIDWVSPNQYKIIDLGAITANTVYSIIFIYDSDNNFVNGYLDGTLISTLTGISQQTTHGACIFDTGIGCTLYLAGDTSIGVGATKNDILRMSNISEIEILEGNYFTGNIGEISSWNTALTAAEVIGIQDYLVDKWNGDITAPIISSSSLAANSILPKAQHEIDFTYSDETGGSGIDVTSENIILQKWNGSTWITDTNISNTSTTVTQAKYNINNLVYGKYRLTFTIADISGNVSMNEQFVFYIDEPSMVISTDETNIGTVNHLTNTFAGDVTITVKTIGAPFRIQLQKNSTLSNTGNSIAYYSGGKGFGFDKNADGNIFDISANEIIGQEALNINTNGNLNTYTYTVKMGAIINQMQAAGEYEGEVDFKIELDY